MESFKDYIYQLTPMYEDLKYGGKGWYRLKWKPIKNRTYNLYISPSWSSWSTKMLGIRFYDSSAHNGWGRSWDGFAIEIGLIFFVINFWIHYKFCVMECGPLDVAEEDKRPLDIRHLKECNRN